MLGLRKYILHSLKCMVELSTKVSTDLSIFEPHYIGLVSAVGVFTVKMHKNHAYLQFSESELLTALVLGNWTEHFHR